MTTLEIGKRLVELCAANANKQAVEELYANDIVNVEAFDTGHMPQVTEGKDAVLKKHDWWFANVEIHSNTTQGPYLHGENRFAVYYALDVTMKDINQRMPLEEIGLYTVENGKIVKDEFFNTPM